MSISNSIIDKKIKDLIEVSSIPEADKDKFFEDVLLMEDNKKQEIINLYKSGDTGFLEDFFVTLESKRLLLASAGIIVSN